MFTTDEDRMGGDDCARHEMAVSVGEGFGIFSRLMTRAGDRRSGSGVPLVSGNVHRWGKQIVNPLGTAAGTGRVQGVAVAESGRKLRIGAAFE